MVVETSNSILTTNSHCLRVKNASKLQGKTISVFFVPWCFLEIYSGTSGFGV